MSAVYRCPLLYGEERQVQAHSLVTGLRALPCIPAIDAVRPVTEIPNGTFVTFVRWFAMNDNTGEILWEFCFADDRASKFYLAPENLPALWRAKRVRPRNNGWR